MQFLLKFYSDFGTHNVLSSFSSHLPSTSLRRLFFWKFHLINCFAFDISFIDDISFWQIQKFSVCCDRNLLLTNRINFISLVSFFFCLWKLLSFLWSLGLTPFTFNFRTRGTTQWRWTANFRTYCSSSGKKRRDLGIADLLRWLWQTDSSCTQHWTSFLSK